VVTGPMVAPIGPFLCKSAAVPGTPWLVGVNSAWHPDLGRHPCSLERRWRSAIGASSRTRATCSRRYLGGTATVLTPIQAGHLKDAAWSASIVGFGRRYWQYCSLGGINFPKTVVQTLAMGFPWRVFQISACLAPNTRSLCSSSWRCQLVTARVGARAVVTSIGTGPITSDRG
jgi:hypothetical protein